MHLPFFSSARRRAAGCAAALFLVSLTSTQAQTPGSLDTTFGAGTNLNVTGITLQADGKAIITGNFITADGVARSHVARLNTDGSLDASFNPGTGADANVVRSAVQSDSKIVVGGAFQTFNGVTRQRIVRLNADGSVDTGFDPGSGPDKTVAPVAIQTDGKILIGGNFATVNGFTRSGVARLNTDGSVDTGFDPGTGINDGGALTSIKVQSDGRILIAGTFGSFNGATTNGVARLDANGSLDTSYNAIPGLPTSTDSGGYLFGCTLQPDGKAIITGAFTTVNGVARNTIARLNTDGSLDTSFDPGSGPDNLAFLAVVQASGKIVVSGQFESFNGVARNNLVRLNADGSVDTGFDPGSGTDAFVYPMAVQADGNIVIGGGFVSYNGVPAEYIARVNGGSGTPAFFNGQAALANGVYYLSFPSGNYFGYYSFLSNPAYLYHFDLGYEYVFDAKDGKSGVYLYDFKSGSFFYSSPSFPFPYLYDFSLKSTLYYYPDPKNAGHYNTDGVRYFYEFATGKIISK